MSKLVTKNLQIEMAKRIYDMMDLGLNNSFSPERKTFLYAVLGKQQPWPGTPEVVPDVTQDVTSTNDLFRNGLFAKRLSNSEASFVVRRINWKSGLVYDEFSDYNFDFDLDFYVMNSSFKVFKCLDNNSSSLSLDEPDITLSSVSLEEPYIQTNDGYKWKYLYTLSSIQKQKFLTVDWMPVSTNKFVSASAINGSIDIVRVVNSGNNYTNGPTQSIISVDGDGTGAVLKANVSGGQITDVVIQDRGFNYTYADLTVTDVEGGVGESAQLEAVISPQNGHGSDPVYELGASTLIFDCDFGGNDTSFLSENDYRQVFILKNPSAESTGQLALDEKYTCYYRVKTSPGLGDFNEDEVVFQGTNFTEATFIGNVVSFDAVQQFLYINNIKGNFSVNQSIKGLTTGSIRIINLVEPPSLKLFTGKVLYISNVEAVSRNTDQTDRIRFILSFTN
jgi:hypothetical protein